MRHALRRLDRTARTKSLGKHFAIVLFVIAAGALTLLACLLPVWILADTSPPEIRVMSEVPSPDRSLVATVFSEVGGGAAGYNRPNVALHAAGEPFDPRERLLLEGGRMLVDARGLSDDTLEVRCIHTHGLQSGRETAMRVRILHREE